MGPSASFGVPKTNISTFSIWEGALRFGRCNASLPHGHPPRRRGQGWSWPSTGTAGAFNPGPSSSFLILPSSSFPTSLSLWVCSACQRAPVATHRTAGGLCLGFASAHIAVWPRASKGKGSKGNCSKGKGSKGKGSKGSGSKDKGSRGNVSKGKGSDGNSSKGEGSKGKAR